MYEDGYVMIGYSSFNAGEVDENEAISQAKKVHASVVYIYTNYTNTNSGAMPLTLPSTTTSTTTFNSGTAYTTTRGTSTTYIPYHTRRYDYVATYWVKINPKKILLGTRIADLTTEARQEIGSNKGMMVVAVINGSPAFDADIIRGDILRKIGDIDIYNGETYTEALERYKGQSVTVLISRKGTNIEKKVITPWWASSTTRKII